MPVMHRSKLLSSRLRSEQSLPSIAAKLAAKTDDKSNKKFKAFEDFRLHLETLKPAFAENFSGGFKSKTKNDKSLNDFEILGSIGQGSFGSVLLGLLKEDEKTYAVKVMNKGRIIKQKQVDHTRNERQVLCSVSFPFLISMVFNFKDNCNIVFVLPYISGGDLFTLLRRSRYFKEKDAKFYGAQVILGIEYLHFMDIAYRDLKPENIVIDQGGYVKITDFGFCKEVKLRTYTLCGTPEYLAPEVILCKGYSKAVDWWSVGILLYEMLAGYTPFYANDALRIYEKITSGKYRTPPDFGNESKDLIQKILQVDVSKRFGNLKNGVYDIKGHDFFKSLDWYGILQRKINPPYIPRITSPTDVSNFENFQMPKIVSSQTEEFAQEFDDF